VDSSFQYDQFVLKKQIVSLTGILRIFNPGGQLVLYCQQKIFRIKEDIRVYSDDSKSREVLIIKARQVLDFSAYFDVMDSQYSTKVGGFRRKGIRSLVQDEWEVFNPQDNLIGILKEDSLNRALLRRFLLGRLLPQDYDLRAGMDQLADYKQEFNLLQYIMHIDFRKDAESILDHRLGLAAAILLAIIEGKQHREG